MYVIGLILSLLIGVVLGLVGGGGSILTVPLVHFFFGESLFLSTTYSLFVVSVSATVGVLMRTKNNQIDFREGIIFVIPSMLTAFLIRKYIMAFLGESFTIADIEISKDTLITVLLLIVMFYTAFKTLLSIKPKVNPGEKVSIGVVVLFGVLTGVLSGFIGAGGGFIIVPILLRMGLDMKRAASTSMFIIAIQSAVALLGDFTGKSLGGENAIDWNVLIWITIMTVVGVLIGGKLQHYFSGKLLRKFFAILLIAVAGGMLLQFILK